MAIYEMSCKFVEGESGTEEPLRINQHIMYINKL